jgi:hypothetical protein
MFQVKQHQFPVQNVLFKLPNVANIQNNLNVSYAARASILLGTGSRWCFSLHLPHCSPHAHQHLPHCSPPPTHTSIISVADAGNANKMLSRLQKRTFSYCLPFLTARCTCKFFLIFPFSSQQWSLACMVLIYGVRLCHSTSQISPCLFNNLQLSVKCPNLLKLKHLDNKSRNICNNLC